jgi:hypothetical protein
LAAPFLQGIRGLFTGIVVGLVVAGAPAMALLVQNSDLHHQLSNAQQQSANNAAMIANMTREITLLNSQIGSLSAELQVIRGVVNFSSARIIAAANLTLATNHGQGYSVGAPDPTMGAAGYIAVLFRGAPLNPGSSLDAQMTTNFINKSVKWVIFPSTQCVLFTYQPPMGGLVDFTNSGTSSVWVSFEIVYLT